MQRLELEHTREELAKHTNAFALQRFETTFYNLLNSNRILIESITIDERVEIKGYKAFEKFYAEFKGSCRNRVVEFRRINNLSNFVNVDDSLANFDKDTGLSFYLNELNNQFANRTNNISIFIDNLTTFLRFLHNNSLIDESEKMFYRDVLRSQLTPEILCLVFYLAKCDVMKHRDLNFLIHRFEMVDSIPKELLVGRNDIEILAHSKQDKLIPRNTKAKV
ncbi:MAG: hypothetical protein O9302_00085 [Cyclobacteriaceae bacterium]|nr:hypothetical protein [Cyclobacteriaceae bacterium]